MGSLLVVVFGVSGLWAAPGGGEKPLRWERVFALPSLAVGELSLREVSLKVLVLSRDSGEVPVLLSGSGKATVTGKEQRVLLVPAKGSEFAPVLRTLRSGARLWQVPAVVEVLGKKLSGAVVVREDAGRAEASFVLPSDEDQTQGFFAALGLSAPQPNLPS
ncbi:MAG: hypothetical protein ACP5NF_07540, partial [Thermoanaerobaculum sp.]